MIALSGLLCLLIVTCFKDDRENVSDIWCSLCEKNFCFFIEVIFEWVGVNDLVIGGWVMTFFDDGADGVEDECPGTTTGFGFFSCFASRSLICSFNL